MESMTEVATSPSRSAVSRGPPDYTSRPVKLRLFTMVAAIMLVSAVVERAFFRPESTDTPADGPVDSRLVAPSRTAHDPAGTFVSQPDAKPDSLPGDAQSNPLERTWRQAWRFVLTRLPSEEKSLLFELLYQDAIGSPVAADKKAMALDLIPRIQKLWDQFRAEAVEALSELKPEDQSAWHEMLRQVDEHYAKDVLPSLQAMSGNPDPLVGETTSQPELLETLASIDRASIQDDTPMLRPAERDIWFFEFGKLLHFSELGPLIHGEPSPPQAMTAEPVNYLQLHRQPAEHRGKLLKITGMVRQAYRTPASPNHLNVKEYCVFVINPAGGANSPIFVYALAAPHGFPRLGINIGDPKGKMREEVEVTGVFFKRGAYAARGGTYTAPLLLANVPKWHPAPAPANTDVSPTLIYKLGGFALAALLIAICLTAVLWKRSSSTRESVAALSSASLVELAKLPAAQTPAEHLRQLEQSAPDEGTP
jgi:hypothetical protein